MPAAQTQSAAWLGADDASFKKQIKLKYAHIFSTDQTVELWANTGYKASQAAAETPIATNCAHNRRVCGGKLKANNRRTKNKGEKNQLKSNKALCKYAADLNVFLWPALC